MVMAGPSGAPSLGRPAGAGQAVLSASLGPSVITSLATDSTGGHFTDQYGTPKLWVAAETWGIILRAGEWTTPAGNWQSDYDNFFAARAAQGVTVLMVDPVGPGTADTSTAPPAANGVTWDGVAPFVTGTNPTSGLNSSFWTRIDYMFTSAARNGVTIGFTFNLEYDTPTGGVMNGWTSTQFQNYGTAVGNRYKNQRNLVWLFGNDAFPTSFDASFDSILTGIRGAGDTHLAGAWWEAEYTSRYETDNNTKSTWGTTNSAFNFGYTYNAGYFNIEYAYGEVANQGASSLLAPIFGDGYFYQGGTVYDSTLDRAMRQEWWWCLADAARGICTESENVFPWSNATALASTSTNWSWANNLPNIATFIQSLPGWHRLSPDLSSSLVTGGRGTKVSGFTSGGSGGQYEPAFTNSWVAASLTADGSLALLYLPNHTTITIDQSKLQNGYSAFWVDPVTCARTSTSAGSTYNSTAKGSNSQGDPDWALLLKV